MTKRENQALSSSTYTLLFFLFVWGVFGIFTSVEYGKFYWLMSGIAIGLTNNSETFAMPAENAETQKVTSDPLQNR